MNISNTLRDFLSVQSAHAHCDIPCGIYDPISAKIAAQTVLKMVMRIKALEDSSNNQIDQQVTLNRYTLVKEQHAELTKHEIDILWHDYFKPEHLEKYPDLHTKVWEATKLAASNKQNVDLESAKSLVESVDEIASIFWSTKGVTYNDQVSDVRFGT